MIGMAAAPVGPEDRLDSWKEIAAYLKRGVRTVQRWERLNGLPVHRLELGAVYAYKSELDLWWQSRKQMEDEPSPSAPALAIVEPQRARHRGWIPLSLLIFTGLAAGPWLWNTSSHRGVPALAPVPLTSDLGREIAPSFSPDGTQVAYGWNGPTQDNWDIYIKTIASEKVTRLTGGNEPKGAPAWSPDGRHIAFLRVSAVHRVQLALIAPAGGPERIVTEIEGPGIMLGWSRDSRWLVFTDFGSGSGTLAAVNIDTGERSLLTSEGSMSQVDMYPGVAPDGSGLVFARSSGDISELYYVKLTPKFTAGGEPRALTSHHQSSVTPAFTADSKAVVYSSGIRDDRSSLWMLPVAPGSGPPQLLFQPEGMAMYPAISLRRHRLAFSTGSIARKATWRLELNADFQPAGEPALLISSTHTDYNAQYSPDGRHIVFHSTRPGSSEIFVSDADGKNVVRLTYFNAAITGSPRWSPDGQWIVFTSNKEGQFEIYRIRSTGGSPERLTNDPGMDGVPSFSHDGKFVYFLSNRSGSNQVWKMAANGRDPRQITRSGGVLALESPDGKWLYYCQNFGMGPIYRMRPDGGPATEVLPRAHIFNFFVTPTGVLFSKDMRTIELLRPESGKVSEVYRSKVPLHIGLGLSPDQRHLLFSQSEERDSDLMLVEHFQEDR